MIFRQCSALHTSVHVAPHTAKATILQFQERFMYYFFPVNLSQPWRRGNRLLMFLPFLHSTTREKVVLKSRNFFGHLSRSCCAVVTVQVKLISYLYEKYSELFLQLIRQFRWFRIFCSINFTFPSFFLYYRLGCFDLSRFSDQWKVKNKEGSMRIIRTHNSTNWINWKDIYP